MYMMFILIYFLTILNLKKCRFYKLHILFTVSNKIKISYCKVKIKFLCMQNLYVWKIFFLLCVFFLPWTDGLCPWTINCPAKRSGRPLFAKATRPISSYLRRRNWRIFLKLINSSFIISIHIISFFLN